MDRETEYVCGKCGRKKTTQHLALEGSVCSRLIDDEPCMGIMSKGVVGAEDHELNFVCDTCGFTTYCYEGGPRHFDPETGKLCRGKVEKVPEVKPELTPKMCPLRIHTTWKQYAQLDGPTEYGYAKCTREQCRGWDYDNEDCGFKGGKSVGSVAP